MLLHAYALPEMLRGCMIMQHGLQVLNPSIPTLAFAGCG